MTSGRPEACPRTSYQMVAPFAVRVAPGPLGAAGMARAGTGSTSNSTAKARRIANLLGRGNGGFGRGIGSFPAPRAPAREVDPVAAPGPLVAPRHLEPVRKTRI